MPPPPEVLEGEPSASLCSGTRAWSNARSAAGCVAALELLMGTLMLLMYSTIKG